MIEFDEPKSDDQSKKNKSEKNTSQLVLFNFAKDLTLLAEEEKLDRRFQLNSKIQDSRKEDEFDSDAARKKSHSDASEAWKQPLGSVS